MTIQRYRANDLAELFDKITKNSIGLDQYIDQFWQTTAQTYPPFNIVQHNNHESSLEIALAGFKKKETEYVHRGMAQRSFNREWQLTEDVEIKKVTFEDGLLTVDLGKVVPEHHARKDYL